MPHVSRHVPIRKVSDNTFNLFMQCVTAKWSQGERQDFFEDLLTPTERIMFSKRLAIIYMLAKGYTFDAIQETLRVSPSTVARIWKSVEQGKYVTITQHLQKQLKQDQDFTDWFSTLMPPMHQTRKKYAQRMQYLHL